MFSCFYLCQFVTLFVNVKNTPTFICPALNTSYFFFIVIVFFVFLLLLFTFYDSPSHNKIHQLQSARFVKILLLWFITQYKAWRDWKGSVSACGAKGGNIQLFAPIDRWRLLKSQIGRTLCWRNGANMRLHFLFCTKPKVRVCFRY